MHYGSGFYIYHYDPSSINFQVWSDIESSVIIVHTNKDDNDLMLGL